MREFIAAVLCTIFGHRWKWRDDARDHACTRCALARRLLLVEETSAYLRAAQQKQRKCDLVVRTKNKHRPIKPPPL